MLVELNFQRLSGLGYQVVTSTSSMDALKLFEAEPDGFDLVITDYTMPAMTGIDLARALLAIKPGIPVILSFGPQRKDHAGKNRTSRHQGISLQDCRETRIGHAYPGGAGQRPKINSRSTE